MFAKQSTRKPDESGSSNDPLRPSSARRRSTQRQNEPESRSISLGNYKRVVDNEYHVSNPEVQKLKYGIYFAIRSMWHTANELYVALSNNDEVNCLIDNAGWSTIFSLHMPKSDRGVVEPCIRRWWDTTHTFHLPTYEIGLTLFDFTMITGISIGGKLDLPPYTDGQLLVDTKNTLETFFPMINATIDSGCIKATNLNVPPAMSFNRGNWRAMYIDAMTISNQLRSILLANSMEMSRQLRDKEAEIEFLQGTGGYRPSTNFDQDANETYSQWPSLDDN
ncbi:hypothetical protein LguiB_027230 [Lonicera macranthoides]